MECYLGRSPNLLNLKMTSLPPSGIKFRPESRVATRHFFSQASREVLTKPIIQAIPTYALWRICRHPEKLLSRVLRARYFPNYDIFSASLGIRPSITWRVLAAQILFRAGCKVNEVFRPQDSACILSMPLNLLGEAGQLVALYQGCATLVAVCLQQLDTKASLLFFCICWTVWWVRNRKVMEPASRTPSSWRGPPPDLVKINFDGATFDKGSMIGVARDANGQVFGLVTPVCASLRKWELGCGISC
ncbi:UNVERIFIED_CONTAM: hypothetical protein Slati_2310300 [Sesamum latifolium]|uniref:RNase H type-1 domain-containing protein n=1 Tax=Sesamum latifolium TaxID=2727402 RepID=A0AAW2WA23_9LAMI